MCTSQTERSGFRESRRFAEGHSEAGSWPWAPGLSRQSPRSVPPRTRWGCGRGEGGAVNVPDGGCTGYKDVSRLGLQSASQPRLSYAEMAEDYPRYPDIHDLDLTLLNPRMIVVSRAVPVGPGPWRWPAACPARS